MEHLNKLAEFLPGGAFLCKKDIHLTVCSANPALYRLLGYGEGEFSTLFSSRLAPLIHGDDRSLVLTALEWDGEGELEFRLLCNGGGVRRMLCKVVPVPGEEDLLCGLLVDITQRRESQEALRLSAERMQVIMDQTNDIIFEWDLLRDVIQFSSNWRQRFGYSPISTGAAGHLSSSRNVHADDLETYLQLLARIRAGTPYSEAEFRVLSLSDKYLWHRARATVQYDDEGLPVRAVGVLIDINVAKHREQRLLDQATRDSLTELYNKTAVQAQTEALMATWKPGTVQALMIIDLDDFKQINDQFGHLCGDGVLTDLAACLRELFRTGDNLGRIGGDEFLAYLPGLPNREVAMYKAKAILDALAQLPLRESGARGISCSIGIAFYPADGDSYCQLYRCADLALYRAKMQGKSAWSIYDPITCQSPAVAGLARHTAEAESVACGESLNHQLAQFALQMLYSTVSTQTAVQQILELTGRTYDVSRAYVFEMDALGKICVNTFEWCDEGVAPQISNMRGCPLQVENFNYLQSFDENGIFYCRDTALLDQPVRMWVEERGIHAQLQCAIRDENTILGFVGFDDHRAPRYWTREQVHTLSLVAGVLSTFLLKLRLKERVAALERL